MENSITLAELKPGDKCKARKISGKDALRRRLLDMGVTPGVLIEVIKVAPLGDPVDIRIRGYHLSLRKEEAAIIQVEVI